MRKFMFIFLTMMLFGLVFLSACGDNDTDENVDDQDNSEPEEQQDEEVDEAGSEDGATSENDEDANDDTDSNDTEQDESNTEEKEESNTDEEQSEDTDTESEVVVENEAFRIFEPAPDAVVGNEFTVRGEARVFEANIMYEFEDGHNILDEGHVMASQGAPEWGKFEIAISFDEVAHGVGTVILYEESAKDGSRVNEIFIPVTIEQ